MKIEKGQKYLCVEQVMMNKDPKRCAYTRGQIYTSEADGRITDNFDNKDHWWETTTEFDNSFQPLSSSKWAIKRTPENAEVVNRWANETFEHDEQEFYASKYDYIHSTGIIQVKILDGYTEIDLTTFREITGSGEEKEFKVGDWVVWKPHDYVGKILRPCSEFGDCWYLDKIYNSCHKKNLRHATPEEIAAATQQKIYTIEDVRNGKCAIENDGTAEQLNRVLKVCFPYDPVPCGGTHEKYYANPNSIGFWNVCYETNLSAQSVKLFLKQIDGEKEDNKYLEAHTGFHNQIGNYIGEPTEEWQPKWGQEVEVSDCGHRWRSKIFIGINPRKTPEFKYIVTSKDLDSFSSWKYCRKPLEIHTFTTEQAKQDLAKLHNLNVNQIKIVE